MSRSKDGVSVEWRKVAPGSGFTDGPDQDSYAWWSVWRKDRSSANPFGWSLVCFCLDEDDADEVLSVHYQADELHRRHPARWTELAQTKKPDPIGLAFALLEASILHHYIERDGWTPDDECYMETCQHARELIEVDTANQVARAEVEAVRYVFIDKPPWLGGMGLK